MITQDDLKKHSQLLAVIAEADYKIKGDAILAVASLIKWYQDFGLRMKAQVANPPVEKKDAKKKKS